jgi:DNA-binding transcriptional regulator YiaG
MAIFPYGDVKVKFKKGHAENQMPVRHAWHRFTAIVRSRYATIANNGLEGLWQALSCVLNPGSWQQASRFAQKVLGNAELKSFEDLRRRAPVHPVLVFLTNTDYHRLRALLRTLKPASPDVVIYYANRLAPEEAAQLGKLVGETRPHHTSVVFEAKAAAASVRLHSRSSGPGNGNATSANRTRQLREHFGLTQTELAHSLGVRLRTVQNWERAGIAGRPRQRRVLEELWTILKDSIKSSDIPAWLRSESDAFAGQRPIELLKEGKARDIIVEFRRLQALNQAALRRPYVCRSVAGSDSFPTAKVRAKLFSAAAFRTDLLEKTEGQLAVSAPTASAVFRQSETVA